MDRTGSLRAAASSANGKFERTLADMKRYAAFRRGIHTSGRHKMPRAEWRSQLEKPGFREVRACLNSGNVAFSSGKDGTGRLTKQIASMIREQSDFDIPVFAISKKRRT